MLRQLGDRLRHLHRAVDLGFPEFTRYVHILQSELATTILSRYPTAAALRKISVKKLAKLVYDGSHHVGETLARSLIEAAKQSVGAHHSEPYQLQVRFACEDIELLRRRLRSLEGDIERRLMQHEVGKLLTTIDGVGPQTAACIMAETGTRPVFTAWRLWRAMSEFFRGCMNRASARRPETLLRFHWVTPACGVRCGCLR